MNRLPIQRHCSISAHSAPMFPRHWIEPIVPVYNSSTVMCCFDGSNTEVIELSQLGLYLVGTGCAHNVYKTTRYIILIGITSVYNPSKTLWVKKHHCNLRHKFGNSWPSFVAQLCQSATCMAIGGMSVCLSVTCWYWVKTNDRSILCIVTSDSARTLLLQQLRHKA